MRKKEFLEHWTAIPADQKVRPCPVRYKHKGSTYDEDGIRITGSPKFIDSVLSLLKGLLEYENGNTRLQVMYKQSTDRKTEMLIDGYNCYIQVHERGSEAKIVNAYASAITGKETIISRGY